MRRKRNINATAINVGVANMAYIEPMLTFHPPSLKKEPMIPTDDPMETSNKYLDRLKRVDPRTMDYRLRLLLKQGPPEMPWANTTAVGHHQAIALPFFHARSSNENISSKSTKQLSKLRAKTKHKS